MYSRIFSCTSCYGISPAFSKFLTSLKLNFSLLRLTAKTTGPLSNLSFRGKQFWLVDFGWGSVFPWLNNCRGVPWNPNRHHRWQVQRDEIWVLALSGEKFLGVFHPKHEVCYYTVVYITGLTNVFRIITIHQTYIHMCFSKSWLFINILLQLPLTHHSLGVAKTLVHSGSTTGNQGNRNLQHPLWTTVFGQGPNIYMIYKLYVEIWGLHNASHLINFIVAPGCVFFFHVVFLDRFLWVAGGTVWWVCFKKIAHWAPRMEWTSSKNQWKMTPNCCLTLKILEI